MADAVRTNILVENKLASSRNHQQMVLQIQSNHICKH